jgi:hypothetical protein
VSTDNSTSTGKTITVVKNDKFKNICIYVNLTLQNNLVRALPRKIFYELENALDLTGTPVNTNITGTLSLNTASWGNFESQNSGYTLVKGVGTKFKSQINLVDGQFTYLLATISGITRAFKVHQVIGDEAIVIQGWPRTGSLTNPSTFETGAEWTTVGSIPTTVQESFVYTYYKGGNGAFIETMESLNAKRISDTFNNNPSEIEYVTVQENNFFESEKTSEGKLHLVFNPPYDERLDIHMEEFYKNIGDTLKKNYPGTNAWFITGNLDALKYVGLKPSRKIKLFNASIEARLVKYEMYEGSKRTKFQVIENPTE